MNSLVYKVEFMIIEDSYFEENFFLLVDLQNHFFQKTKCLALILIYTSLSLRISLYLFAVKKIIFSSGS